MAPDKGIEFNPKTHHRRSIRLAGYDYSQAGAYFVTIVVHQRRYLFGEITDGKMELNDYGKIADECWRAIPKHFPHVELGAYVVMPNHVHGIIMVKDPQIGATHASPQTASPHIASPHIASPQKSPPSRNPSPPRGAPAGSLGAIVGSFKSAVSKYIHRQPYSAPIWQRNYYEHIIRNDHEMEKIWRYIESNPTQWENDKENPSLPF